MKTLQLDETGYDNQTFAPFELQTGSDTESRTVQLQFVDWDWIQSAYNDCYLDGYIDEYYLNGPGVEGLVKAVLFMNGIAPELPGIDYDSEADACLIYFEDLDLATRVADMASEMLNDPQKLREAVGIAREHDFDDG